ncbi:MAG: hypothetical protein GVY31_09040 [Alphaproteobacteria bacterium]|jgi:heme-degrading monooxygenase HmoA|nr:hypothetical protein [Alphaproteobacteria bacterium]
MFAVVTQVDLKPGAGPLVAALFEETNPPLVRDQPGWLGAEMLLDQDSDAVIVIARWRDPAAYKALADSPEFRETMQRFSEHFAGPPRVRVCKTGATMTPQSVKR